MGVVFKAFDPKLHRTVAIKALAPQLATAATARRRFEREARSAAAVSHDHVVAIYDVQAGHNPPYLVMHYVAGGSLQQRLDAAGPLALDEILRVGIQTADGLAAAHAQGLIHRDVKPANILLDNGTERVKLTDFGLARAADDASLSQSGVIAGTPMYMSPEQARGDRIDHRTDLFSLGSVLYAACTGRPPFEGSTAMGVLKRVCEEQPQPIREINPDVPEWLCAVIARLMAKDPAGRYQSAAELAELLRQHQAHPPQPEMAGPAAPPRPARRHRLVPLFAAGGVLAALVVGFLLLRGDSAAPPPPEPPEDAAQPADRQPVPEWEQLFNGNDLTGWKTAEVNKGQWSVKDNLLVGRGAHSYLYTTRNDYENFHFRVEARVSDLGVGGQGFRVPAFLFPGREQYQGYEARIGSTNVDGTRTGSLLALLGTIPTAGAVPPAGEWFTQEVIADGRQLTVKVNGETTAEFTVPARSTPNLVRGYLLLYTTPGSVVEFRKVEVKELPRTPGAPDPERTPTWREVYEKDRWPNRSRITVGFVDAVRNPQLEARARELIPEWTRYANVDVAFVGHTADAMVRITFDPRREAGALDKVDGMAFIGIDSQDRSKPKRAAWNLFVNSGKDFAENVDGTILHEFGHILGLYHEEMRVPPPYDEAAVCNHHAAKNNWSREYTSEKVLKPKFAPTGSALDPFDAESVMLNPRALDPLLMKGGQKLERKHRLSEQDKRLINSLYPGRWPNPEPPQPRILRTFWTWDQPLSKKGVQVEDGGWRITANQQSTVALFEVPHLGAENCQLTYRATMKASGLDGAAYLRLLPYLKDQEFLSKNLSQPLRGTRDWTTFETSFTLNKGQVADRARLELLVNGAGTLWIKDVQLLVVPLPGAAPN